MKRDLHRSHPSETVSRIARDDYFLHSRELQHVFLTGDLRKSTPHPFFRDERVEFIYCDYQAGDDGEFHWHHDITEYQIVVSGAFGHLDAASGETVWCGAGDVSTTPAGICTKRIIRDDTVTIALKIPSIPGDKVFCADCARVCDYRQQEFQGH